ncbi:TVP38/TMEM64 family protein [Halorubellus litoreus]|uniref:TVP38/TMEM64 family protein n=1 Tax=Halorubellus litoreus TaxID=755308 RepID=A0ABD5VAJ4_9EURY
MPRLSLLAPDVDRGRVLAYAAALAVLVAVLVAALGRAFADVTSLESLRALVLSTGPLAPATFVLAQAMQVVVAPIPGQTFAFLAGYLFGPWRGVAYSLLGATIGTYVAVRLASALGRERVERLVDDDALTSLDAIVDRRGLLATFLVFLVPGVPDDVVCFAAGLLGLDARDVALVSVLGRFPGYLVLTTAGAGVATDAYATTAVLLAAAGGATLLAYLERDRIYRALADVD